MRIHLPFFLFASAAFAQNQFEVATVRPNTLNDRIVSIKVGPGGRFTARGYTLVLLIQRAYGVMDWNVTSGPSWIRDDRFDIAAKASVPGDLTEQQLKPMLQKLLADRFKLKLHESSKETRGYALVVARGGPKMKEATEEHPEAFRFNGAELTAHGISMHDLAKFVCGKLGVSGVDETGLKGLYNVDVKWTLGPNKPTEEARDDNLFTASKALEDQLGLKLVPKSIKFPTLVIDQAEKASADAN